MDTFFLVKVSLPDWAGNKPTEMEMVRDEIEQHAGAAAAYYTRAAHVTATCETAGDKLGALDRLNKLTS